MKRSLFFMLFLNAFAGCLIAQNSPIIYSMEDFRFKRVRDGLYTTQNLKLSDIQGTPYLVTDFISGKIVTSDGSAVTNIPLRYNAFTDDLEFKKGDDVFIIDPKSIVKKAEFGGAVFSYMSYFSGGKIHDGFLKILTEGKATLLARYSVGFMPKEDVKPFIEPKPARFKAAAKENFITFEGTPAKSFSNKKGLLELFGEKKGEMEAFISKNNLSVKDDDQLILIVKHYNTL